MNTTDIPLMADVTLDGRADIVIARLHGKQWRGNVSPSSSNSFGSAWGPPAGRRFFGASGERPLIGVFGRFHTVQPWLWICLRRFRARAVIRRHERFGVCR